jgi:hypothetical protein
VSVLEISSFNEKRKLKQELREWQERLRLCYEFDWKDPCKAICHSEVKRLKELIGEETIFDKMANLK